MNLFLLFFACCFLIVIYLVNYKKTTEPFGHITKQINCAKRALRGYKNRIQKTLKPLLNKARRKKLIN